MRAAGPDGELVRVLADEQCLCGARLRLLPVSDCELGEWAAGVGQALHGRRVQSGRDRRAAGSDRLADRDRTVRDFAVWDISARFVVH